VASPAAMPLTTPDEEPTVAVPGALLVHTPPGVASLSAVVSPMHTCKTPVIGKGEPVTQNGVVA
jgi:hypothetical protein